MATYKISGTSNEVGVSAANLVIAYKADRSSVATMGQELGRATAVGGVWQILYDDWAGEVFVVCLDATDAIKYKAKMRDWVVGILVGAGGSIPALPPTYDEFYTSVVVRIHADTGSLLAGSGFDSIAANAWTFQGGALASATEKKFGVSSIYFDGVDDSATLTVAPDSDRVLPDTTAAPFTVEAWIYPTTTAGDRTIAAQYLLGDAGRLLFQVKSGNLYAFHGQGLGISGTASIPANTWTHVALTFDNLKVVKGYVNAVLDFTSDWSAVTGFTDSWFTLGARYNGSSVYADFFEGYIDEVRVTRDNRYPSGFTLPTQRFSNFGKAGANSVGSAYTNYIVNGNAESNDFTGWTAVLNTSQIRAGGYAAFGVYSFGGHASNSLSSSNFQWVALPSWVHTVKASAWQFVAADNDNASIRVEWFEADQTTEVGTEINVANAVGATPGDIRYFQATESKPPTATWAKVWMLFNRLAGASVNTALDEYTLQFNPEPESYWAYPEPLAANVVSRLNFLEPDASQFTVDRATIPLTWVFIGGASVQAFSSPFGDVVGSYRGVGNGSYMYTDGLAGVFSGTNFACIRFWVKVDNLAAAQNEAFFFVGTTTSDSNRLQLGINPSGQLNLFASVSTTTKINKSVAASTFITSGQWHHVVLEKNSYNVQVFIDGKHALSGYTDTALTLGTRLVLGGRKDTTFVGLNGNIADVQILTGVAPHVTEFAPPPWLLPIP